jgi:hypothetical protein
MIAQTRALASAQGGMLPLDKCADTLTYDNYGYKARLRRLPDYFLNFL